VSIAGRIDVKNTHRRVIVLSTLITVLTLTSALLLALAPAPLTADASSSLFAIDAPISMDAIFQTDSPVRTARWKYIYVHHSRTTSGNAMTLARSADGVGDHFVIGNGDGCMDGEIQIGQRWNKQLSALPPAGAQEIDKDCISICLVGDFDRSVPTPTQLRRLQQLTAALQSRLRISGKNVLMIDQPNTSAGSGRYFPATVLREQLLP
jgi:hypothetical protein